MSGTHADQSTLARAVQVLEAFDVKASTLTASDIARRTGLPMASAHRIIGHMVALGLLERDDSKRLRVGVRAWELASRSQRVLSLREAARPYLEGVQATVQHHTQLGVRQGHHVLYVELMSASNAVINITRVASRLPLHACSSGHILLAFAPPEVQEDVLSADLAPLTPQTITDPKALRRTLAEVRRQGVAVCRGAVHEEAAGVAVPIRDRRHRVAGAIAVIIPNDRQCIAAAVPALLSAAHGMSSTLSRGQAAESAQATGGPR